ncbi:MAG: PAS domain-containing protein [Methanimicrococcus sp.]|nr:PAS domain-containing protein [Methanimicrococcus sp.]
MKLEYKVVMLSVMIGILFILAETFSRFLALDPMNKNVDPISVLHILFEPLTTNQGIFFVLIILLLCTVFGLLLASLISQVLKAKDAVKQKDIEQNTILEFVPEIVIYLTLDECIKWVSHSFYLETELTENDIVGKKILEMSGKLFKPEQSRIFFDEFEVNKRIDIEIQSTKGKYWRILSNPSKDENGSITGYVLLAIDITDNKRDEKIKRRSYEQLESNINQFAAIVDNIRNPLSSIVLLTEIYEKEETAAQVFEQCGEIEEVISRLDEGWAKSEDIRNFLKEHL